MTVSDETLAEVFDLAFHETAEEMRLVNPSPAEINSGRCRIFALNVLEQAQELTDSLHEDLTVWSLGEEHTWLEYDGEYYDAEQYPNGVSRPDCLPIFADGRTLYSPEKVEQGFPYDA